jgi:hypothetical protein
MKKFAKISAIILVNLIIVLLLLEILLRVFAGSLGGAVGVAARWVTTGQPFDQNWTQAWQQNIDHYWVLRPDVDNALQYGSPSVSFHMSTIELWENGGIGFRTDPVNFYVDAVVVGDSFGMCFTEREDCWVDIFAARTGLGLVNLSQPVTGTSSHLRILRDFGTPLFRDATKPPLVIWQFFGNDFNDDYGLAVFRDEIAPLEEEEAAEEESIQDWLRSHSTLLAVGETILTGRFTGVPDAEALYVKPYRASYGEHVLQFGGAYELQALNMSLEMNQLGLGYSRESFQGAQDLVNSWGGNLLIVLIPTREEVYRSITEPIMGAENLAKLQSARETMLQVCQDLDLRCYDAYPVFAERAANDEALYYEDDMHLNAYGNLVLAEALQAWLMEDGLLGE